ncbi:MAG: Flp family type IVb pilin [Chloroflexi bacterium]|nr:Flp family type IVb pilin [Chloroflexota bacterium]
MKYYFYVKNFALVANEEEGQGLAEYGLIIALVAVIAIAGVTAFGTDISAFLTGLSAQLGF